MYEQADKGNGLTVVRSEKKINRVKVVKDRGGAGNTIRVEGVLLT